MNTLDNNGDTVQSTKDDSEKIIRISAMHKWFGSFHVLRDLNLEVATGERIVICGPSGSGKSTLIRCINRLEIHQKGDIVVDNIELSDDLKNIEKIRSEVGMDGPIGRRSGSSTTETRASTSTISRAASRRPSTNSTPPTTTRTASGPTASPSGSPTTTPSSSSPTASRAAPSSAREPRTSRS